MSNKAELERKCLIANLEEKDRLPEQTALYEHREAWLSEQKYIKEQGGIDAANHKFSEAQATLHEALHNGDINIQQIQNAQNVIQERYKFLRNKAVPRDNIKDKNDKLNELGTDDLGLQNQRVFQNLAQEERSNNPLSQDYLPDGQKYAADHIVSFKRIWKMPGFQELNIVDQLSIIRDGENFQPLNRSLNSSKGEYGYDTWKGLQNGPDLSNDSVYQEVARMESEIEQHLQKRIVEAEIKSSQYITEQGGIDAADHAYSEAQTILTSADQKTNSILDSDKKMLQNAQQIVQDRKEFLSSMAVPQNYVAETVVPFEKIWDMPGFQELNIVDQLSIVRDGENFQPLNKSLNSSKREKSYSGDDAWKGLKNGVDLSNDSVYQEAVRMESEIEQYLQKRIVEAEIKSLQYVTEQGGLDAADHAYSEAQTILTSADQKTNSILDSDKKMLQNAQQIVQDRKEFLSSMAVPQNYVAETVVPFEKIWDMPGFQELNIVDQLSIVRDGENFHSLDTSFNATDHNNFIRIEKHLQDMVTERLHEMNDVKQVEKDFVNSLEPYIEREEERLSDAKDSEIFDNKPETNHEAEKNDEKNTVTSVEEIHEEVIEIDNENEEVIENEDILDEIQEMENIQELNDTNELEELNEQDNIHDNSIEQEEAKNKENEQEYEQEQISNQLTYS